MAIVIHLGPARLIPDQVDWNIATGQVVEVTQGQSVNLAALLTNTTGTPAEITHIPAPNALPAGTQLSTAGVWSADISATPVTSTGHQLLADTNPGFQSFSQRRAQSGVIRSFGLDQPSDLGLGPNGYGYGYNYGWYAGADNSAGVNALDHPTIDTSIGPSGGLGASLLVTDGPRPNNGGLWTTNFSDDLSVFIRDGESLYIQWRQRFDSPFLAVNPLDPGAFGLGTYGGWKQCLVSRGDTDYSVNGVSGSCTDIEVCPNAAYYGERTGSPVAPSFLTAYYGCPGTPSGNTILGSAYGQNARPSPFCTDAQMNAGTSYSVGNCFPYVANEWMTFQVGIDLGTTRDDFPGGAVGNNSRLNGCRFRLWSAREGQAQIPLIDVTRAVYFPLPPTKGYGKWWMTTRYAVDVNFIRKTWYGQLIISRSFIANPL